MGCAHSYVIALHHSLQPTQYGHPVGAHTENLSALQLQNSSVLFIKKQNDLPMCLCFSLVVLEGICISEDGFSMHAFFKI